MSNKVTTVDIGYRALPVGKLQVNEVSKRTAHRFPCMTNLVDIEPSDDPQTVVLIHAWAKTVIDYVFLNVTEEITSLLTLKAGTSTILTDEAFTKTVGAPNMVMVGKYIEDECDISIVIGAGAGAGSVGIKTTRFD